MPPRKDQDSQHVSRPRGSHGFVWGTAIRINLPFPLPGPAHTAGFYEARDNIIAAYEAGFLAAARGAYGLPAAPDDTGPMYRTVAVETTREAADVRVARCYAGPEWLVHVRQINESTWAIDVARADEPPTPIRKPTRARSMFDRAA